MKDLLRYTIKEQEEFDELFDKRLRRIFTLMKSIPDVDKFMNYFAIPTHNRWSQEISNILKLFGVNVLDTNNRHLSSDSYNGINTFYETFLQNGGSSIRFKTNTCLSYSC